MMNCGNNSGKHNIMMQGPMSAPYNGESNTVPAEHKDGGASKGGSGAISSKQPLAALQGTGLTKSIDFISSSSSAHAPIAVPAHVSKASSSSTPLNLIGFSSLSHANLFAARRDHHSATATGAPAAALPEDFSLDKNNSSVNISLSKNNVDDNTATDVRNAENVDCPDENTYDDMHVGSGKTNPFVRRNSIDKIGGSAGFRYKECLKNHAANMGGYAVDGCGEFMPSGEEGSLEALKCAACGCHRNFHRREVNGRSSIAAATSNSMSLLALPSSTSTSNSDYGEGDAGNHTNSAMAGGGPFAGGHYGGGHMGTILAHPHHHHHQYMHGWMHGGKLLSSAGAGGHARAGAGLAVQYGGSAQFGQGGQHPYMGGAPVMVGGHVTAGGLVGAHMIGSAGTPGKRFRTKFTMEQREKMFAFSEKVGWRIHKHDEAAVQQFCAEAGIKRHVLKIWMHNNKNTFGKKLLRFPEAFDALPKSSA